MKILQIHTSLRSGGIEAFVAGLSNELINRHEVCFCSIYKPSVEDIFLYDIDKRIHICTANKKNKGFDLKCLFSIYSIIKRGNYDIVNIHGYLYYYLIPIILLHNKIKFFYTIHSDAIKENSYWDRKIIKLKRYFFRKGWIRAITISKESQRSFSDFYHLPSRLIYNGVKKKNIERIDINSYRITSKTKIFIHPGRITEAKNQIMLCKVFYRLQREGYDVVLLLAGELQDKTIYANIEKYFNDRIKYLGVRCDVIDMLCVSDAFCLSSIWEGMPISLLESLSVACIPICTPVGGIPEAIIDGVNGFLSNSCEEEDYYIALKRFLNADNETIFRMKQKCLDTFEQFNIKNTAVLYEQYYME